MSKRKALAFLMVLVMVLSVMPLGISSAVPIVGEQFPVATGDWGQVQPDIDYPWIVWKDERAGDDDYLTDIYAYNLVTGEESVICTAPGEQSNPGIYGDVVVYSDDREDPTGVDSSSCDIYGFDISKQEEFLICDAPLGQGNPYIYGDNVVWVDHRGGESDWDVYDIYMKNLTTGVESAVCTLTSDQSEPVMWENYVAYYDNRLGNGSIFMTDIESGEETCVAASWSDGVGHGYYSDPSISDGYIAASKYTYVDSDHSETREIVLIDIDTHAETVISTVNDSTYRKHPVVRDGWVTWHDYSIDVDHNGIAEVYGYDLAAEEETCLVPAVWDEEAGDGGAYVSWAGRTTTGDGMVVWHDHRVEDPAVNEDGTSSDDLYAMALRPIETVQNPVEGTDRFGTSVQVSEDAFPEGADTVIVTTGYNWPDALAAASLAGVYNAPVLLTWPSDLPGVMADEIERLGATDAFILGSTVAVSAGVEAEVEAIVGSPATRLGGANRFETAELIAAEVVDVMGDGWDGTAFVATGMNFPDALAASPLSSYTGYPILLARADGISDETQAVMDDLGVTDVLLLGSPGVLPATEGSQGGVDVTRIAGDDRYETAIGAATWGVEEFGMAWSPLAIATGENYPDALSAGPAQGMKGSVMLLTTGDSLYPATEDAIVDNAAYIGQIDWIGGLPAISQDVRDEVAALFEF